MENNVKEKNNSKGVIVLLCIIIVILLALCTLFATGTISLSNKQTSNEQTNNGTTKVEENNQNTSNTISNMSGEYTVELTNLKTEDDNNSATLTLSLYENGIFTYTYSQYAPYGTLGNYVITGNKLILTTWFNTDSGTGLHNANGTKTLVINNDNTITDNNVKIQALIDSNISTVNLTKTSKEITSFDVTNRLNAACLNGECGNNSKDASL